MEITFLMDYAIPVIVGICLCIGYIIKNFTESQKVNKFIPLILAVVGVVLNVWINMTISPQILLGGMFSGIFSTGLHQVFKNLIEYGKSVKEEDEE